MDDLEYAQEEIAEGKSAAILAYIPFVCLVPLLNWRDNRFASNHAKQGLALFIIELAAVILLIPGLAVMFIKLVLTIAIILAIIGITRVLQDRDWKIPLIGRWIDHKASQKLKEL